MYEDVSPAGLTAGAAATLPFTGITFDVVLYVLVAFALIVGGLLLTRLSRRPSADDSAI